MSSWRMHLIGRCIKPVMRWRMGRMQDAMQARVMFERASKYLFREPPFANYAPTQHTSDQTRDALWVNVGQVPSDKVILYLHGGGYLAGSPWGYRKMVAFLSRSAGMRCFVPSYRLAPENPLPGALEDVIAAYDHLREIGYRAEDIVVGGDSAGGGLAFALLAELCARGEPPAAVFGWSPCLDLTYSGASVHENARRDHIFPGDRVHDLSAMILGQDADAADPRVSPLFAAFPACCPVLLQVGEAEILRDDAIRMEAKLREGGTQVRLEMWEDAPHVWQLMCDRVPEAVQAIENTGYFIREHVTGLPDRPSES